MAAYDVFISYRRDGGSAEARLLQSQLQARHIKAFLDVTELGRGYFDDALLRHIEQTPNFVVILSPNCLNRGEQDEDWLRKEIAHALATDRNVIPLMMPGFQFPPKLPKDLRNLPRHNGMDYSHLYFDAMMQKLVATLDLSASDAEEYKKERPSQQQLEKAKLERAALEEERATLEKARQETEARRKSLELRQAEDATRRKGEESRQEELQRRRREGQPDRWSTRVLMGDLTATPEVQQGAIVAFWSLFLLALAFLGTFTSANDAQAGITLGILFLALAGWVRMSPRQAATGGLVVSGLATIGMLGVALSQNFNIGRMCFTLLGGTATFALWRLLRTARAAPAVPVGGQTTAGSASPIAGQVQPTMPFGAKFAALVGVSGPQVDIARLRIFFAARLISGLVFSWALASANRNFFTSNRVNYFYVIWGAASVPIALAGMFRWLRSPIVCLGASAVIAAIVNPLFWQGQIAMLILAQEFVGMYVLAWAIGEVENTAASIWFGAAGAIFSALVLQWLWGARYGGWYQSGPNFARAFLLAFVFAAVLAAGMTYLIKPRDPAGRA